MREQECPHHAANGDQAGREMCTSDLTWKNCEMVVRKLLT